MQSSNVVAEATCKHAIISADSDQILITGMHLQEEIASFGVQLAFKVQGATSDINLQRHPVNMPTSSQSFT